jgi:hypothetical protein
VALSLAFLPLADPFPAKCAKSDCLNFGVQSTTGRINVQNGRNHNSLGFTYLLAGGGVKGGIAYGATDEFGFAAVDKPVHLHDLHATILHLLGLDHKRLTYRHSGRDYRLTDVAGNVVTGILA